MRARKRRRNYERRLRQRAERLARSMSEYKDGTVFHMTPGMAETLLRAIDEADALDQENET